MRKIFIYAGLLTALLIADIVYNATLGKHPDGDCLDPRHERNDPNIRYTSTVKTR